MKKASVLAIFLAAGYLRLFNLGYSEFQGDEVKALYDPRENTSVNFLLEQRKGPMQFLITAALKDVSGNFTDRFLVRLPFALAGTASVVLFYFIVRALIGGSAAIFSTIFFATNGFLVAFSRIVQYQSMVIFFGLLCVHFVLLYTKRNRNLDILLASVFLSLSLLAHYDGVFFIPVIAGMLLKRYMKADPVHKHIFLRQAVVSVLLFILISSVFYIPFALNIAKDTMAYWNGRLTGNVSDKISSSAYLFALYQPYLALPLYLTLGVLGAASSLVILYKHIINRTSSDGSTYAVASVLIWFTLPFIFFELIVAIPGTHIYSYIIPLMVLMGLALDMVRKDQLKILPVYLNTLYTLSLGVVFLFLTAQSHYIFVDHSTEYPWNNEQFFGLTLKKPSEKYHLSLFGFPYYRHWEEVSAFINKDDRSGTYSTNERDTISDYYMEQKRGEMNEGYYVFVHYPQKISDGPQVNKALLQSPGMQPLAVYKNRDTVVTEIFFLKAR